MKKVIIALALMLSAASAHAFSAEKSQNVVNACVEVSTTVHISVSNSAAGIVYSSTTFTGIRAISIQNLDASANLWCNYGSCVSTNPASPCVGFKVIPGAILVMPLTPVSDQSKSPNFGYPFCLNDGTGATNAVASLCR